MDRNALLRLKEHLQSKGSVVLSVRLRPGAAKTSITGEMADGSFKISVAAPPEAGKANTELIRFLSEQFAVASSNIQILSGMTSRKKLVRISSA